MIQIYRSPDQTQWEPLLKRPLPETENLQLKVEEIIRAVKIERDEALYRFTRIFDKVELKDFLVTEQEYAAAKTSMGTDIMAAIQQAKSNIEIFHHSQVCSEEPVETMPGVKCWRLSRPIERVGLYIPGGSAPLFSTVLMLAIPAQIAGCKEIILCTPPQKDGTVHPAILYAASITGVTKIFKLGGAQAIAAMALGTQSIPKVDKIFGPGNHFVTEAKVAAQQLGVAIDLPAGPSEVLIIADHSANPDFVAADMISQAEHGADSQVVLLTTHLPLVDETKAALEDQLKSLPRADIARTALQKSMIIHFASLMDCLSFSNRYAPEHLILSVNQPRDLIPQVLNAGSVFLGHFSPESVGDYASGTNHTLPTGGWARSYSGVSVDSFVKKITFQELSQEGLSTLGPHVEIMAEAESLMGHKRAVTIRLKSLS
jgi:histidinol dehydrogenase